MSKEQIPSAINETSVRVLEDWALMLVEPTEYKATLFDQMKPWFLTQVEFHGPVSGVYCVVCQEDFAHSLAANLLGADEEPSSEMVADALREMVNVLSGNLLTACYGEDVVFDLIEPHAREVSHNPVSELRPAELFSYMADGHPVVVTFFPERR